MAYNSKPWEWVRLTDMPRGAESWAMPGQTDQEAMWNRSRRAIRADPAKERFMAGWLRERVRAFAIETGQIEGLYTLRRGVTEQLVAEGFAGVAGAHTVELVEDRTIRGLLEDQQGAYDMMFEDVASGRPLSQHMVRSWHQLLTRHQETVTGLDLAGNRVAVRFVTKGRWKERPNNPRRADGHVHFYCPPEQVQVEMDRFFAFWDEIRQRGYPVNAEAAWLHHRFVRTHPFQDGNGRVSRLLMAWAYIKRGFPPPVITAQGKPDYIDALEVADEGDLRGFSDHIGSLALTSLINANRLMKRVLTGRLSRPNGNGGRTVGDSYYPPLRDPAGT